MAASQESKRKKALAGEEQCKKARPLESGRYEEKYWTAIEE